MQGGQQGGAGLGGQEPVDGDAVADGGGVQVAAAERVEVAAGGALGVGGGGPALDDDRELGRVQGAGGVGEDLLGGSERRPPGRVGVHRAGGDPHVRQGGLAAGQRGGEQRHVGQPAGGADQVAGLPGRQARRAAQPRLGGGRPVGGPHPGGVDRLGGGQPRGVQPRGGGLQPGHRGAQLAGEACSPATRPRSSRAAPSPASASRAAGREGSGETVNAGLRLGSNRCSNPSGVGRAGKPRGTSVDSSFPSNANRNAGPSASSTRPGGTPVDRR